MHEQTAVVVLAAGAGTRMRSKTPKVLHQLGGRSMLSHSIHAAHGINPDYLITVIGHDRELVGAALDELAAELGREIRKAVQEEQLGTGHAVQCALAELPEDFTGQIVVTAADVPLLDEHTFSALLDEHRSYQERAAVTVLTCVPDDANGYGRIVRTEDGEVAEIVEHADATPEQARITEVNSGVYAFDAKALRQALSELKTSNAQHEFYLTDVVRIARTHGWPVYGAVLADAIKVSGVNDRVQLSAVTAALNRYTLERHMRAGVTIVDPASTWIDVNVQIAQDVTLHPGVQLHGSTSIAEDAVIGPDTTLRDVTVGAGAHVIRTHGSDATLGAGTSVGPFAYLRPGTVLGENAKLGTFVEAKNATIGPHSKVPHLTYVGDATIGEYTNIGASSVFVNYDGVKKHHTVIGSHVRTGSDNMFVAPVTIGDGAYTGAGTVVRRNVPPGTLAVSVVAQRHMGDWVQKKRPGSMSAIAAQAQLDREAAAKAAAATEVPDSPVDKDGSAQ